MKVHLTYLSILLVLVGLLILQRECQRWPEPTIINDTITIPGDPFPVLVNVGQPDPIYVDVPYILPAVIDTMQVIVDYFSKYHYADTLKNDTSAFIAVYEEVTGNRITNRSYSFQNRRVTQIIHNTTILPEDKERLRVYAGAMLSMTPKQSFDLGPSIYMTTPKGYGYSYAYGINEKTHTITLVWKVKLRSRHPPD